MIPPADAPAGGTTKTIMAYRVNNLIYAAGGGLINTIRSGITLTEPVDGKVLKDAVRSAILRYPYFSVRLVRRGEEYVMEHNSAEFAVSPEGRTVCLGTEESNGHLMAFAYKDNTIYIDSSHYVMDGTAQFPFVKTLLYYYLHAVHPEETFDMAGIALSDSEIPAEELDDDPYPDEPVEAVSPMEFARPDEIILLEDQPQGYENRGQWTSFRIMIPQGNLMKYASSVDGSPASFFASVMYLVISDLYPGDSRPVVCGMQHQFRNALGRPKSHLCHVNIAPLVYPARLRGRDISALNTMTRGMILLRSNDDTDLLSVNAHIRNERSIQKLTLPDKFEYMRKAVLDGIGKNTFEVSYTGRVPFSGLDKYVTAFTPYIDMTLSGGISIEIFAVGENFEINLMQRNNDASYVRQFAKQLEMHGVKYTLLAPEHFEICDFRFPD